MEAFSRLGYSGESFFFYFRLERILKEIVKCCRIE